MIDSNNDGVCTLDEWINILEPAIKAENKFIDIMGGLDIKNPLILEEQILDLTFKSRRLNLQLKELERTTDGKNFIRKKQAQDQIKAVADEVKQREKEL